MFQVVGSSCIVQAEATDLDVAEAALSQSLFVEPGITT